MAISQRSVIGAQLSEKLANSLSGAIPDGIPRRVWGAVALPNKATAVIGMRRSGKTMFLHQLRRERLARGVPREYLPYLNFEDDRLAGMTVVDLSTLIEDYYRRLPATRGRERVTWCLDEIQLVPEWERFIRRLLDSENVEIFVSGSSAALLSREIATGLRGRAWEVVMHPYSFEEALHHRGLAAPAALDAMPAAERSLLEHGFLDWLVTGGFPEAQGLDAAARDRLLHDYVDVAILRDVVERHEVSHITGLRWLVRHLLGNAASTFSVEKFYAALKSQGLAISKDTVHHLLAYLEDCFLVRTLWLESASERQRMVNPRKAYPIDPGLIPLYDRSGRSNLGHALETAVMLELERRRCAITYVRTRRGHEVDFLARTPGGGEELIQVCADPSNDDTMQRELRALVDAAEAHPQATKRLLVATRDAVPVNVPDDVIAQPAYEWMLAGVPASA